MKFEYDVKEIAKALDYQDLKGLILMLDKDAFNGGEPSVSEMEVILEEEIHKCADARTRRQIESLMVSCARVNSIGY